MTEIIESFEVTKGKKSGDLLSEIRHDQKLKVGLLACGYFEYWRMYAGLREEVVQDMQAIADRLGQKHDIIYPGLVETLDTADDAGQIFKNEHIDVLVISQGTYCPDYFVPKNDAANLMDCSTAFPFLYEKKVGLFSIIVMSVLSRLILKIPE